MARIKKRSVRKKKGIKRTLTKKQLEALAKARRQRSREAEKRRRGREALLMEARSTPHSKFWEDEAKKVFKRRSKRSKAKDLSRKAVITFPANKVSFGIWKAKGNRIDLRGVDTP